jgi:hypothetical protein
LSICVEITRAGNSHLPKLHVLDLTTFDIIHPNHPLINFYSTAAPTNPATATAKPRSPFIVTPTAAPVDTGPVLVLVKGVSELETDTETDEDTDVAELTTDDLCDAVVAVIKPQPAVAVAVAVAGTDAVPGTDVNNS